MNERMETVTTTQKIDIFRYNDYRMYLKDFFEARKKTNPNFSHRVFARKAGFVSPSLLLLIIQGKRNMTLKSLPCFIQALSLNVSERKYFELLVQFNQSKDPETKKYYYEQLFPVSKKRRGKELEHNQYDYLSQWHCAVIRELVGFPEFQEDPKWICRKLNNKVTPAEVRKTIEILLELKLLRRDTKGRLLQTDHQLTTPPEITHLAVFKFHMQMLDFAKQSLHSERREDREISSITTALSEKKFAKIKKRIQEFQDELMHELEAPEGDPKGVYQLNFQLFSLTNLSGENHD